MNFAEETIETQRIFQGRVISLRVEKVRMPDGKLTTREIVSYPNSVACVIRKGKDSLLLIRQYRKSVNQALYEIPAGKVEKGEDPEECVKREVEEEAGYKIGSIRKLAEFYTTPGFCDELMHLFLADAVEETTSHPEADELIETCVISFQEALEMIRTGKIRDAKTILGILFAHEVLRKWNL